MCSHMLAGASATSSTIGNVVEDVETVVGASSGAALALEMTIASACCNGVWKILCEWEGLCVPANSVDRSEAWNYI